MIKSGHTIWILVVVLTLVAAKWDWHSRRIPNWLTVPGFLLGITLHSVFAGWQGAKVSLEGAGLALAALLPLVLLRALGAGDWKLMGAVGSFLGPILSLFVLIASFLIVGLMAAVHVLRKHRVVETLRNIVILVKGVFSFGLRAHPQISLDNPELMKLPFGVAVAAATVICYGAALYGF